MKSGKQESKTLKKDGGNTKAALDYSKKAKILMTFPSKHYRENIV